MKNKRCLAVGLLGVTLVFSGCKKEEKKISFDECSQFKDIDTSDYVTVGEYKGLSITADTIPVSEMEVNTLIASQLYEDGFYVDANELPVTAGCQIKISVRGYINGSENQGFTSDGYEFVYGSGEQIIDGFTANLEGHYQGDQIEFDIVVPSSFGETALVGKTVTFKVTIDNVQSYYTPELTDEYVQEVSDVETVADYKESLIPGLREEKYAAILEDKKSGVWKMISDNSTVTSYPEGIIEAKDEQLYERLEMYAKMLGMEVEDYVYNYFGVTYDEYVKLSAKQDLLLDAIGRTENISLTEKEYKECLADYAEQYGYSDTESMLNLIGEDKVKEAILWDQVMQYVADQVTIIE